MECLEKLPKNTSHRILRKIYDTENNPHRFFKKLTDRPEYKLRVGEYRVIADIKDNELIILVIHIGHRKNVYEK